MGKLNHTRLVIPTGGFFLARLRYILSIAKKLGPQQLMKWEKEYLDLWLIFVIQAIYQGIGIHHITSSIIMLLFISDARKMGIGGLNSEGIAWLFELPLSMQGFFALNLL